METLNPVVQGYLQGFRTQIDAAYSINDRDNVLIKHGLRNADGTGVLIGTTGIGSVQGYVMEDGERVPMPGKLTYRGIDATEIAESHYQAGTFGYEEVAYLLLLGKLPTNTEFQMFKSILASSCQLPSGFNEDVIFKAPSGNVMNQLARSVLALYAYDPMPDDLSPENLLRQSIELTARLPLIVANAYAVNRHYLANKSLYIHNPKSSLSVAENFLRMVRKDKSYTPEEAALLDLMLIIHAEHGGGNNSTFVCRAASSTGTDTYSAISAAIGSLKGPLHGGANAKVMSQFADIKANVRYPDDENELREYLTKLLNKQAGDHSGKIYGLGHAVYTISDPRAELIKAKAGTLAESKGRMADLQLMQSIERIGKELIMERRKDGMPLCANVDMYSGLVYDMLGIPVELYTPLFAIARIAGWCANRMEEVLTCNRIMRPAYRAALKNMPYIPQNER
ncbi:MAG: citrate synthase [Oscillospiraceae bacterium]|nr:citrate synthase [Oscillospiraceae bacterium]